MKSFLRHTLAVVALTAIGASAANAASDELLDKCIAGFVSSELADYDGKITIKKESDASYGKPLILRAQHIELMAVHRTTGAKLATAKCKNGREGVVLSIKTHGALPTKVVKAIKTETVVGDAG
jgi:hypothetical protein